MIMLGIVILSMLCLSVVVSFIPVWCVKWKYKDPSKASLVSGDYSHVPLGWMCGEDKDMMLWVIMFGQIKTGKTLQSYTKVYGNGVNIKYKIGLFG